MIFRLTSPAFEPGGSIPTRYTCEGEEISPPLAWTGSPLETESFVLIMDDPDVPDPTSPRRTWVHWVVYDIPGTSRELREGISLHAMPDGSLEGKNDSGDIGYGGPYPPVGRHRYFFRLYALDRTLELAAGHTKSEILRAMHGHVLGSAELMGTYQRASA
jgi:hypothetical protein